MELNFTRQKLRWECSDSELPEAQSHDHVDLARLLTELEKCFLAVARHAPSDIVSMRLSSYH